MEISMALTAIYISATFTSLLMWMIGFNHIKKYPMSDLMNLLWVLVIILLPIIGTFALIIIHPNINYTKVKNIS